MGKSRAEPRMHDRMHTGSQTNDFSLILCPICADLRAFVVRSSYPTRQVVPPGRSSSVTPSSREPLADQVRLVEQRLLQRVVLRGLLRGRCGGCSAGRGAAASGRRRGASPPPSAFARGANVSPRTSAISLTSAAPSTNSAFARRVVRRRGLRASPSSAMLVQRRDQLEQHADGAAGVEVVVHVLAEPSVELRERRLRERRAGVRPWSARAGRRTACR